MSVVDAEFEFTSFVTGGKGLTESQVLAKIGRAKEFDRIPHPIFEDSVEEIWKARLAKNPKLFNGSKFRLHSFNFDKNGIAGAGPTLTLEIGLTSYKDFLGTNCSPNNEKLRQDGIEKYGQSQVFLSDALAVGVLVETSDKRFLIIERSQYVSEAQGLLDGPGGHAEPEKTPGFSLERGLEGVKGEDVVKELFQSIIDEIVDEINVPANFLRDNTLMGFSKNPTTGGRKCASFLMKCDLTSAEVMSRYTTGGQKEADESVALYCWTEGELLSSIRKPEVAVKMAIAFRHAVQLYTQILNKN